MDGWVVVSFFFVSLLLELPLLRMQGYGDGNDYGRSFVSILCSVFFALRFC